MTKRKSTKVSPCRSVKGRAVKTEMLIDNGLTEAAGDQCRWASEYLVGAFDWHATAEGYDFWRSVYLRLIDIANGASLK